MAGNLRKGGRMNRQQWLELLEKLHQEEYNICKKKNEDYSSLDDPFENFRMFGELGFLVRMSDKMSRLKQYLNRNELSVENETIVDTLQDLSNYSNLLIGYLADKKQKQK